MLQGVFFGKPRALLLPGRRPGAIPETALIIAMAEQIFRIGCFLREKEGADYGSDHEVQDGPACPAWFMQALWVW